MTVHDLASLLAVDERLLRAVLIVECGTDALPPDGWRPTIRVEAHKVLRLVAAGQGRRIPGPDVGMRIRELATGRVWGGERGQEPPRPWADLGRERTVVHEVELDGAWVAYHGQQSLEYDALDVADAVVGPEAATACTSWGMAQVMGVPALGLTWQEIRAAAAVGGGLGLMARFFEHVNPKALDALRRQDLGAFALAYNGDPAYAARIRAKL